MNATGDCYEAAAQYMMSRCMMGECNLVLLHGEVMGQGHLEGTTFGHAWVLDGGNVVDKSNGRDLQLPQQLYYAIGQIDNIGNVHEYTWEEARRMLVDFEHYGPWELETESGL